MLKLLIVDDEKTTRDAITKLINWDELGIGWVGEAEDGLEALNIALVEKPDIILTDIKMPRLNGVELSKMIREKLPNCKIIFLSGYSDKEYLKAAIEYKVLSYVEKPIVPDELFKVFKTAVYEYQTERSLREKNLYIEMSAITMELISNNLNPESIIDKLNTLGLSFPSSGSYITVIVHIKLPDKNHEAEQRKIIEEYIDILKSNLSPLKGKCLFGIKGDNSILIHIAAVQEEVEYIEKIFSGYLTEVVNLYPYVIHSIAIGTLETGLSGILKSYNNALSSLQKCFFKGVNRILNYTKTQISPFSLDEKWFDRISASLAVNDWNTVEVLIKRLNVELRKTENTEQDYVRNIYFRLITMFSMYAKDRKISLPDNEYSVILDTISNALTIDEIERSILSLVNMLNSKMHVGKSDVSLLARVIDNISRNYTCPDLSVNSIAEDVFLTASYLCVFFKKNMGKTLNQYITEYRIEKAKELLKGSDDKIQVIAMKVGYKDTKYFSRVFEKITGIKPKGYRNIHHVN